MTQNDRSKAIDKLLTKELLTKEVNELRRIDRIADKYGLHYTTISRKLAKYDITISKVIYRCDEDIFSKDTEEAFYLAGFIAADGCVNEHTNKQMTLTIALSDKDKTHLLLLKELLRFEGNIFECPVKNSKRNEGWKDTLNYGFRISSDKICNDLRRFNIVPRKTKQYTFPEWLKCHPLAHHFMRGYNDGDGCIRIKKKNWMGKLDFQLVGQPAFLSAYMEVLGENCNIDTTSKKVQIRKNGLGVIGFTGNPIVIKIADFLYKDATIYLPRKLEPVIIQKTKQGKSPLNNRKTWKLVDGVRVYSTKEQNTPVDVGGGFVQV
jgi:Staphylococcus phage endonuclease